MPDATLAQRKRDLRRLALDRRRSAVSKSANEAATKHLIASLEAAPSNLAISGYMPIGTEIDPVPALTAIAETGRTICLPVIQGRGQALLFRHWTPASPMIEGDFGALIPRGGDYISPGIVVTPLLAFDATGARMGYGGGFYDRTLQSLQRNPDLSAIGFAFAAQEIELVPTEPTDQRLDAIVTENGIRHF